MSYCPEGSQYDFIINRIRHPSCGFTKLYSPRFKCQQGKEGNISYIPLFTKAYGSLRVKKEGNIASGYFVIFITHQVRVCAFMHRELLFCDNGAQIGLRALYCDVIITLKAHCFAVYQKFRQALDAQCWFDDVFATFHAEETLCSVGYCILHNSRVRLIKFSVCSRCLMWLIMLILTAFRAIRLTYITLDHLRFG